MNVTRTHTRFGLGRRPDEPVALDERGWLRAQIAGAPPMRPVPPGADAAGLREAFRRIRAVQPGGGRTSGSARDAEEAQRALAEARRALRRVAVAEGTSTFALRVTTTRPFAERLAAFWSDHLCISIGGKLLVGPLAGSYERDVIRAHLFGRYEEMVLASARHPAMLLYLDNAQSVGPRSAAVARAARAASRGRGGAMATNAARAGLNENYARELLELHTLGVNGGYTQQDVTELARLLTGWGTTGVASGAVPQFEFFQNRHEPGRKTVLGQRYSDGEAEGVRAIRALCRHPATATFIATKLARHFVADEPPASAVERLARVFRESEGDLRAVSLALVDLPECWDERYRKFRTPQDWLVASLRHLNAPTANEALLGSLQQLRMPLWAPPAPKGFGDMERDWADADALLNRAELARTLARRLRRGEGDTVALEIAGPRFQWR